MGDTERGQSKEVKVECDKSGPIRSSCHGGRLECHLQDGEKPVGILKQSNKI